MGQLKVTSRLVLGTQAEVLLEGTVDFRTFEELHKYLLRVLAEHPETIRIDMRNVTYLSSVGVWTLIDAQIRAREQGASLVVAQCRLRRRQAAMRRP